MISSSFFRDKRFSLDERKLMEAFSGYLEKTSRNRLVVLGSCGIYDMPYKTRWSESYKKRMLGQMYGVEECIRKQCKGGVVTLLTLTGYQGGEESIRVKGGAVTRAELFKNLKAGWHLMSDLLSKVCPGLKYVWVMEPHKSGYPHMHVALFGYVPEDIRERLKWLWSEKYGVGSKEHGLDFSVKSVKESIQSVRNYLMKYITKGIGGEGSKTWSAEEWLYHATAWKHHHRYIGMSRSISRYCTAYRLRYRFRHYIRGLTDGKSDPGMPDIPVDTDGLKEIIQRFTWRAPHDVRNDDKKWSCVFMGDRGVFTLIRRVGTIRSADVSWVNVTLSLFAGYRETFIKINDGGGVAIPKRSRQILVT